MGKLKLKMLVAEVTSAKLETLFLSPHRTTNPHYCRTNALYTESPLIRLPPLRVSTARNLQAKDLRLVLLRLRGTSFLVIVRSLFVLRVASVRVTGMWVAAAGEAGEGGGETVGRTVRSVLVLQNTAGGGPRHISCCQRSGRCR